MVAPTPHARPGIVVTPAFEPSLRVRGLRFPGNGIPRPETGRSKAARRVPLVSWETEPDSQSPPDVGQFADREEMSAGSGMRGGGIGIRTRRTAGVSPAYYHDTAQRNRFPHRWLRALMPLWHAYLPDHFQSCAERPSIYGAPVKEAKSMASPVCCSADLERRRPSCA